jgi:cytochrome c
VGLAARIVVAASGIWLAAAVFAAPQPGDEVKGRDVFQRRCGGCHSPDKPGEGPRLRGVYGQRAASTPDFPYSEALRNARLTWTDDSLDKWLSDTESLVPGNDMSFRVPNPDERRSVIAYLKSLSQ